LYLSAFQPRKIKANPTVKEFYRGIPENSYALGENPIRQFACSSSDLERELTEDDYDATTIPQANLVNVPLAEASPVIVAEVVCDPTIKVIRL
jgi:hypothetical protein